MAFVKQAHAHPENFAAPTRGSKVV